jgi:hypothetical protein
MLSINVVLIEGPDRNLPDTHCQLDHSGGPLTVVAPWWRHFNAQAVDELKPLTGSSASLPSFEAYICPVHITKFQGETKSSQ